MVTERVRSGAIDLVSGRMPIRDAVEGGLLTDLDGLAARDAFSLAPFSDFPRQNGQLLGLPVAVQPWVLVYNADRAQLAGAYIPPDQWTWEQFREAALKMTTAEGGRQVWGFDTGIHELFAELRVAQATAPPLNQPPEQAVQETLALFHTMIFLDKSMPKSLSAGGDSLHFSWSSNDPFFQGKAGMNLAPLDSLPHMSPPPFTMRVAPMPAVAGSRPIMKVDPITFSVVKAGRSQEAAWDFLKFMAGPEGARVLARKGTLPYLRDPEAQRIYFTETIGLPPGAAAVADAEWLTGPATPEERRRYIGWLDAASTVMSGGTSVEAAMAKYEEFVREGAGQ